MEIRLATSKDIPLLSEWDEHISMQELINSVQLNRVYIAEIGQRPIGWLRYNLFWDNTPFMNMLCLIEEEQRKGYGKELVLHWERQMKLLGYETVLTSTQSNEYSQHFYVKLGYETVGGFLLKPEPYEIIMAKNFI